MLAQGLAAWSGPCQSSTQRRRGGFVFLSPPLIQLVVSGVYDAHNAELKESLDPALIPTAELVKTKLDGDAKIHEEDKVRPLPLDWRDRVLAMRRARAAGVSNAALSRGVANADLERELHTDSSSLPLPLLFKSPISPQPRSNKLSPKKMHPKLTMTISPMPSPRSDHRCHRYRYLAPSTHHPVSRPPPHPPSPHGSDTPPTPDSTEPRLPRRAPRAPCRAA